MAARVYATASDLEDYLRAEPPDDADRQLERASQLLDAEVLLTAWYDVDDNLMPTHADVIEAFKLAACAQVEFWSEVGEQNDTSGPIQGVTIGSVSIQYGAGSNRVTPVFVAPRVYRALAVLPATVLTGVVSTAGTGGW